MKILLMMILFHCVDDFFLQSKTLSDLKQKKFWEKYGEKYRWDWLAGLVVHSLEWSIMVHIPLVAIGVNEWLVTTSVALNGVVHGVIDHLKCNEYKINLCIDQAAHMAQIVVTWIVLTI